MPKIEVLGQIDGPVAGYATVLTRVHVAPGEQVPRHTHPGVELTYVLEGEGIVRVDGFPDKLVKAGELLSGASEHTPRRPDCAFGSTCRGELCGRKGQAADRLAVKQLRQPRTDSRSACREGIRCGVLAKPPHFLV